MWCAEIKSGNFILFSLVQVILLKVTALCHLCRVLVSILRTTKVFLWNILSSKFCIHLEVGCIMWTKRPESSSCNYCFKVNNIHISLLPEQTKANQFLPEVNLKIYFKANHLYGVVCGTMTITKQHLYPAASTFTNTSSVHLAYI